jgi:hypothetical protein
LARHLVSRAGGLTGEVRAEFRGAFIAIGTETGEAGGGIRVGTDVVVSIAIGLAFVADTVE